MSKHKYLITWAGLALILLGLFTGLTQVALGILITVFGIIINSENQGTSKVSSVPRFPLFILVGKVGIVLSILGIVAIYFISLNSAGMGWGLGTVYFVFLFMPPDMIVGLVSFILYAIGKSIKK